MRGAIIGGVILAALALAGCQKDDTALENSAWLVEEIAGAKMVAPVPTLEFRPEGRLGGKASCNNYGGAWKAENGRLALSGLFATKMACPQPLMAQEQGLLAALGNGGRYSTDGAILTIEGDAGKRIVARRVPGIKG